MYFVGIDWSNDKHDICVMDAQGKVLNQKTIAQSLAGFLQLERIVLRYGIPNVRLSIERSDGLLVDWILARGWALYITPALVVARRRPRRSKSDPTDAFLLAYLLRLEDPDCRLLSRSSHTVLHLRELVRALDHTLAEQRSLGDRLRYILLQYFPTALKLFSCVQHLITMTFFEHFPTLDDARTLTPDKLKRFLKK